MKLSALMNQNSSFLEKPSFLNESIREKTRETPIKVSYNPTWKKEKEKFNKSFSFSSREELKSFCNYVLDFEVNSGMLFDMRVYSRKNSVDLSLSSFQFGNKTKRALSKIDSISKDIKESFKKYE